MIHLNFPPADLKIRTQNNRMEVFDPLRKRYVALTDEEWVRQNLISYLAFHKMVPLHVMASERGLLVNKLPKRFDVVVFSSKGKPVMIVECKAPHIKLTEDVLYQAARYNLTLQVDFLLITNGLDHHCAKVDYASGSLQFLQDIPDYPLMNSIDIIVESK